MSAWIERVSAPFQITSDDTLSMLPSNSRPTSSPFAFSVGDPELPPVVSRSEMKHTGSDLRSGSAHAPQLARRIPASKAGGESNGSLPVSFFKISGAVVNGGPAYFGSSKRRTVPYVMRSVP